MEGKYAKVETSSQMLMPLPLIKEELTQMREGQLIMEMGADGLRRLYPEVNKIPNVREVEIPIVSGITLFSYLRFFNVYEAVDAIDVYVNGKKIASALAYSHFTEYEIAFPGYYKIEIYEAGMTQKPLLLSFIHVIGYRIYTAVIVGMDERAFLALTSDRIRSVPEKKAYLRFLQVSSSVPLMDVYLDDRLVLSEVDFRELSQYLITNAGAHNITLRDFLTGRTLLDENGMEFKSQTAYLVSIAGHEDEQSHLKILIEEEGISFLDF